MTGQFGLSIKIKFAELGQQLGKKKKVQKTCWPNKIAFSAFSQNFNFVKMLESYSFTLLVL